jgi:RimJ/RimL family protein N-acetyltransferase
MVLESPRLILREFVVDDWHSVHQYARDVDVVKFMHWGPNSEDDTKAYLDYIMTAQRQQPRRIYEFAVILKHDGLLIGGAGLHLEKYSQASLGYCFNKQFWGQGLATETVRSLCEYGFNALQLHRTFATCRTENRASARVMEKLGMKRDGVLREHFYAKGQWQNSFLYSILSREYFERY